MPTWQSSPRFQAQLDVMLTQVETEPSERRYPARTIALAMGVWFSRRRRSHNFGYMGRLPYAIPALALTAMLV